jgi:hypothetical protein
MVSLILGEREIFSVLIDLIDPFPGRQFQGALAIVGSIGL